MSNPTTFIWPSLARAGYVQTAPSCGDCKHCEDQPQGTFCSKHRVLVQDNARCLHWQPAAHWLRANPDVATSYQDPTQQLSPSELAYLHRNHTL